MGVSRVAGKRCKSIYAVTSEGVNPKSPSRTAAGDADMRA
jgi:hypothetical protein